MTCPYCNASIDVDEHRCQRCGRRLRPSTGWTQTATAPDLHPRNIPQAQPPDPHRGLRVVEAQQPGADRRDTPLQAPLFGPQEIERRPARQPRPPGSPPAPRRRAERPRQDSFDFSAHDVRALPTSVEAAICCNASVACARDRVAATLIDLSFQLAGFGVFLLTFHFAGGQLVLTPKTMGYFAAAALFIALLYRLLFCLGNGDTPGLRFASLRLLNFDGHAPTRSQRLKRVAGGCLSVVAAGAGLLWALVDEERLAWHDLMSETFPTAVSSGR